MNLLTNKNEYQVFSQQKLVFISNSFGEVCTRNIGLETESDDPFERLMGIAERRHNIEIRIVDGKYMGGDIVTTVYKVNEKVYGSRISCFTSFENEFKSKSDYLKFSEQLVKAFTAEEIRHQKQEISKFCEKFEKEFMMSELNHQEETENPI